MSAAYIFRSFADIFTQKAPDQFNLIYNISISTILVICLATCAV